MTEPISFAYPEIQRCPFPAYQKLREECPVYRDPVTGHYILTEYADVRKVLLDFRKFSNSTGVANTRENSATPDVHRLLTEQAWLPMDTMVTADPPVHKTYRTLVDKVFSSSRVSALLPEIDGITHDLLAAIEGESAEIVADFAVPLPMRVIAGQLGVNPGDIDKFKIWSDAMIELQNPTLSPEREVELTHESIALQKYLAARIEEFRATPDGSILSNLAHVNYDDRLLNMQEMISISVQLIVAGNETTTNALSSAIKLLTERPGLIDEIHADPALTPKFVEETLRIASPFQCLFRRATEDVEIGETKVPAGAIIEVRYGAANRDPKQFEAPDEVDLCRPNGQQHLAFGAGIHMCIGNQLARAELRAAIDQFARRFTNVRLAAASEPFRYGANFITYGLTQLYIDFDRRQD